MNRGAYPLGFHKSQTGQRLNHNSKNKSQESLSQVSYRLVLPSLSWVDCGWHPAMGWRTGNDWRYMVDAIDRLRPFQSATHQIRVFQMALGSLTPEMQLGGPGGGHIFNNSLGDPCVPWNWKSTYLGMVCIDFLPLENQIETQVRVEILRIEYQNHFRYLVQRGGHTYICSRSRSRPSCGSSRAEQMDAPREDAGEWQSPWWCEQNSLVCRWAHVRQPWEPMGEMNLKGTRNLARAGGGSCQGKHCYGACDLICKFRWWGQDEVRLQVQKRKLRFTDFKSVHFFLSSVFLVFFSF